MIGATANHRTAVVQNALLSPPAAPAAPSADDEPDDSRPPSSRRHLVQSRARVSHFQLDSLKWAVELLVCCALWSAGGVEAAATPLLDRGSLADSIDSSYLVQNATIATPWLTKLVKRAEATKHDTAFIVEACFIPILVVLSGAFAGLTLGYMSLDTTQLQVLAKTGNEKQRKAARKVLPLRANGHLLLITLLCANMCFNEALPVVAEKVMGGGVQAVIASTALVIIFAEIIPQAVCSRFGLQIGAAMVIPVRIVIYVFFVISWPIAKLLEYLLGAHEGIVYRRAELKELVAMHSATEGHGDLQTDVVTIVGATLDLQAKVVRDAMTPLASVFSLPIDTKLDFETLGKILKAGHSRIPVYEEVPVEGGEEGEVDSKRMRRKIVGVLLTKQLILLDPEDAVPLRDIPLSSLPSVSDDLSLLQILNTFQEGRSHIAAVHRSRRKAPFPPRLATIQSRSSLTETDLERGVDAGETGDHGEKSDDTAEHKSDDGGFFHKIFRKRSHSTSSSSSSTKGKKEDKAPLDVAQDASKASLSNFTEDAYGEPVGIITLEDVIEELIGEEILDETDADETHQPAMIHYVPPEAYGRVGDLGGPPPAPSAGLGRQPLQTKQSSLGGLARFGKGMVRARSAPGKDREGSAAAPAGTFVGDGTPVTGTHQGSIAGALGWGSGAFGGGRKRAPSPGKKGSSIGDSGSRNNSMPTTPLPQENKFLHDVALVDEPQVMTPGLEETPTAASLQRRATATTPGATTPATGSTTPVLGAGLGSGLLSTRGAALTTAPLLSEAVLVERGRRKLAAQGADPNSMTPANLRLAGAGINVSQPPSRSTTPVGSFRGESTPTTGKPGNLAVRTPSAGGQARAKGNAFKSLSTTKPLPQEARLGLASTQPDATAADHQAGPST